MVGTLYVMERYQGLSTKQENQVIPVLYAKIVLTKNLCRLVYGKYQYHPIPNQKPKTVGRFYDVIKRHQNAVLKKVADHFQCFCIELNRDDSPLFFCKLNR